MHTQNPKRWASVSEIPNIYPSFTKASIRWHIFNKKTNGFAKCLRRIGKRKILIDLEAFEKWVDGQTVDEQTDEKKKGADDEK